MRRSNKPRKYRKPRKPRAKKPKKKKMEDDESSEEPEIQDVQLFGIKIGTPEEETFEEVANEILNNRVLVLGNLSYRIMDVEFFYSKIGDANGDPFIHGMKEQRTSGNWYFRRYAKRQYKEGKYKGIDFTFGNNLYFGSVMVRSINLIDKVHKLFIEGPCNVAIHVLHVFDKKDTVGLINHLNGTIGKDCFQQPPPKAWGKDAHKHFRIGENREQENIPIYSGPRTGLTMKKSKLPKDPDDLYCMKHWRFINCNRLFYKHKTLMLLAAYERNMDIYEICREFNTEDYIIIKWHKEYEEGKLMTWKQITNRKKFERMIDKCRAYGYSYNSRVKASAF